MLLLLLFICVSADFTYQKANDYGRLVPSICGGEKVTQEWLDAATEPVVVVWCPWNYEEWWYRVGDGWTSDIEVVHPSSRLLRTYAIATSVPDRNRRFSTFEDEVEGRLEDREKLASFRVKEAEKWTFSRLLETHKDTIESFRNQIRECISLPTCTHAAVEAPHELLPVFPKHVQWKDGTLVWTRPAVLQQPPPPLCYRPAQVLTSPADLKLPICASAQGRATNV